MAQHTIYDSSTVIGAGLTATVINRTGLARSYSRLDIALQETAGAQPVTAATFEAGVGTAIKRDSTREAAIINASQLGTAGGEYTLTMTDEDVPDALKVTLTSAAGCTIACKVIGTTRD